MSNNNMEAAKKAAPQREGQVLEQILNSMERKRKRPSHHFRMQRLPNNGDHDEDDEPCLTNNNSKPKPPPDVEYLKKQSPEDDQGIAHNRQRRQNLVEAAQHLEKAQQESASVYLDFQALAATRQEREEQHRQDVAAYATKLQQQLSDSERASRALRKDYEVLLHSKNKLLQELAAAESKMKECQDQASAASATLVCKQQKIDELEACLYDSDSTDTPSAAREALDGVADIPDYYLKKLRSTEKRLQQALATLEEQEKQHRQDVTAYIQKLEQQQDRFREQQSDSERASRAFRLNSKNKLQQDLAAAESKMKEYQDQASAASAAVVCKQQRIDELEAEAESVANPEIISSASAFEDMILMMCPKTSRHISIPELRRQLMEERGFVIFEINEFTAQSESELPQAAETIDDVPTELKLPTKAVLNKLWPLYQTHQFETPATQLLRAFDERVVVLDNTWSIKAVYSPCRLWTKELANVDAPAFTNMCKAYYAVMKLLQEGSVGSPADITESQNSLREKGGEMGKPEQARNWFEAAKSVCRI